MVFYDFKHGAKKTNLYLSPCTVDTFTLPQIEVQSWGHIEANPNDREFNDVSQD